MGKKLLLVLDGQVGVLNRTIYRKAEIISTINSVIESFQKAQQPIIFTRHTNKTSLAAEAKSWTLDSSIQRPDSAIIFNKKRSNIFTEPDFVELLKKLEIQEIYVCGFVTNGCVQAACLESKSRGFKTSLLKDAHSTFVKNAWTVIEAWNLKLAEAGVEVIAACEVSD